ncbi:transposase [Agathobacter rectalis]
MTDCVNEYTPNCARCVNSFHVVEWAMAALDEVRKDILRIGNSSGYY